MIDIKISLDTGQFDHHVKILPGKIDRSIGSFLGEAGRETALEMKNIAPRRSGRLADSIGYRLSGRKVVIGPTVDYAKYVQYGTRPHPILPHANVLVFETSSRGTVFTRGVRHPGSTGRDFLGETVRAVLPRLQSLAEKRVGEAI